MYARRAGRGVRPRPRHARGRGASTAKKLDWLNGEWIRRLDARRARRRASSPMRRRALRRSTSTPTSSRDAVAIGQERAVDRWCRSSTQMAFLFVADDEFAIDARRRGRSVVATERVARGARRGRSRTSRRASGPSKRSTSRAGRSRRSASKAAQGDARALRRGRGTAPGACRCSTRCSCSAASAPLARLRAARARLG